MTAMTDLKTLDVAAGLASVGLDGRSGRNNGGRRVY
jgi:hypothetical protein